MAVSLAGDYVRGVNIRIISAVFEKLFEQSMKKEAENKVKIGVRFCGG